MGRALEGQPYNYESNQQRNETIVKLIKPSEISSRILTLPEESDERVIIVSPYNEDCIGQLAPEYIFY